MSAFYSLRNIGPSEVIGTWKRVPHQILKYTYINTTKLEADTKAYPHQDFLHSGGSVTWGLIAHISG